MRCDVYKVRFKVVEFFLFCYESLHAVLACLSFSYITQPARNYITIGLCMPVPYVVFNICCFTCKRVQAFEHTLLWFLCFFQCIKCSIQEFFVFRVYIAHYLFAVLPCNIYLAEVHHFKESLVEEFLTALAARRSLRIDHIETAREDVVFNTPLRLAS